MKILLTTLLILSWSAASAQIRISGVVTDESGQQLPGVNISVLQTRLGTVTQTDGTFSITVAMLPVTLKFSMIGFESQLIELNRDSSLILAVFMRSKSYLGNDIVVSASRTAELQASIPQSVSVFKFEEIQQRNVMSLAEALVVVPGVQMAGNQVNVRGSSGFSYGVGSRVMLLLDGVPLLGSDTGDIKLDGLPMQMVERMEVIKGPGSAMYGSGALGGVVNLVTRKPASRREITVRQFLGVSNPVSKESWRNGWSEGDEWRPFGGTVITYSAPTGTESGYWMNAAFRAQAGWLEFQQEDGVDLTSKYTKKTLKGRFDFFGGYRRGYRENHLYWNGLRNPLSIGRVTLGANESIGGNSAITELITLAPAFTHTLNPKMALVVKGRAFGGRITPVTQDRVPRSNQIPSVALRYGAEAQFTWQATSTGMFIAGIAQDGNAIYSDWYKSASGRKNRRQPENGVYAQWKQDFGKTDVTAGLRLDTYRIEETGNQQRLSPKLSATHFVNDNLMLRMAAGGGFRVPSVAERFVSNNSFLPLEPNLMLLPEISNGIEAGLRGFFQLGKAWGGQWDLTGFWNEYRRLVEPKFNQQLGAFQFQNLTSATIRGLESQLEIRKTSGATYLRAGHTFLDTRDHEANAPLIYRSANQLTISGGHQFLSKWTAGFDYRYSSKPKRMDSDFARFVKDADVVVPVKVLDLRIQRSLKGLASDWTIAVIGRNVTNYYYVERPALFAQPRNVMLQIEARF